MRPLLWTCDDLVTSCGGELFDPGIACSHISGIEIDSRNCSDGDLFITLAGYNGTAMFLVNAAEAKATACLIRRPTDDLAITQIVVDDTIAGLSRLATAVQRFDGNMIGITGSVSKTGSKDMLAHMQKFGKTHASKLSYNNHIGVPISYPPYPQVLILSGNGYECTR